MRSFQLQTVAAFGLPTVFPVCYDLKELTVFERVDRAENEAVPP